MVNYACAVIAEVSGYWNDWKSNFGNGFFGTTAVASSNADAAGHGLFGVSQYQQDIIHLTLKI